MARAVVGAVVSLSLDEVEAAGGYQIVYADVAWSYSNGGRGSTDGKYRGMSIPEVFALPVSRLAARDAVLFTWGTWPFLPTVLESVAQWGFEYKTCAFQWVKYHEKSGKRCVGGGFWTRANTEFCLLGVRGKPPRRVSAAVRALIESGAAGDDPVLLNPRGRHSEKPAEARRRVVELMGDLPRIELFARQRAEGWDAWGDDPSLGEPDVRLL